MRRRRIWRLPRRTSRCRRRRWSCSPRNLRAAQEALAAITGEFTADDLLGVIFSRFCIGK